MKRFLITLLIFSGYFNFYAQNTSIVDSSETQAAQDENQDLYYNSNGFAAHLKRNKSLMIAKIQDGSEDAPPFYDPNVEEGVFRPEGLDSNFYFSYRIFDLKALFAINDLKYSAGRTTDLTSKRKVNNETYTQSGVYKTSGSVYDIDSSGRPRIDREPYYEKCMERTRQQQYKAGEKISSYSANTIVVHFDNYVCFSEGFDKVAMLSSEGNILSLNSIRITEPLVWSKKGQEVYYDEQQRLFYLVCKTNYGFNWYSVLPETGETDLILQINEIWLDPNWKIENGFLTYQRPVDGKLTEFKEELAL